MKEKKSLLPQIIEDWVREKKEDLTQIHVIETDLWFT